MKIYFRCLIYDDDENFVSMAMGKNADEAFKNALANADPDKWQEILTEYGKVLDAKPNG